MKHWGMLVLASCLAACRATQTAPDAGTGDGGTALALDATPAVVAPDAFGTTKRGKDVEATFQGTGWSTEGEVMVLLSLYNPGDAEVDFQPGVMLQVTSTDGTIGHSNVLLTQKHCSGHIPPRGKLACGSGFRFDRRPERVRIRVDGAWFDVPSDTLSDAGPLRDR